MKKIELPPVNTPVWVVTEHFYYVPSEAAPRREQVEALPKCDYCEAEWGTCDPITNRFTMPPRGGIRFCPMCGRPITDEAVDIIMQRLEELKEK